ncbi:MAG: SMC-Scp complex subunit ScpB [Candidatus Muproteobacteria bacterium RBG_16_60_9]|uniref:SMC-Scp complex subunit ScpB n=1 Tax=Candidatus Muproteobacteria bacterium RBG_16_60_9 TaxID=1817755 RepID=A0A1F6VC08_9PROT|nr:MAG: SMC-Scp complex subunit ScpB [Candidatus Muproteobacteria bacterium RBG_16_60_9]
MSDPTSELKNIIEAALLVAGQPLTIDRMAAMFPQGTRPTREEIRDVLKLLEEEYRGRGLELKQVERAYRLQTRDKYSPWLSKLVEERPARYSRALLETLAIIAYRQPVTRGDIEDIRGVAVSTEIIRSLLDRDWVREVGRREVPGRPALYGTTRGFLEYFNLGKLDEMPPLSELRDIGAIGAELDRRANEAGQMPLLDPSVPPASVDTDANGAEVERRTAANDGAETESESAHAHSAKSSD